MTDFFVSYTGSDQDWAEWISFILEEKGFSTIIQAWDFRPGSNFVIEMQNAAVAASRTIMVLSPDYLKSQFTSPEWAAAFREDPLGLEQKLLPVMVHKCDPPGLLGPIVHIRLMGLGEADAAERLLSGANRARAKPSSRPKFPGAALDIVPKAFPGSNVGAFEATIPHSTLIPRLKVPPSDMDKRKFVKSCFNSMKNLFEQNAINVSNEEPRVDIEFDVRTSAEFRAVLFLDGQTQNMCRVQLGGSHSENSITFSEGKNFSDNGYNELISLKTDDDGMYFSAMMASGYSSFEKHFDLERLDADQAAEYLWQRFVSSLETAGSRSRSRRRK
jgi:TIR domain